MRSVMLAPTFRYLCLFDSTQLLRLPYDQENVLQAKSVLHPFIELELTQSSCFIPKNRSLHQLPVSVEDRVWDSMKHLKKPTSLLKKSSNLINLSATRKI